MRPMLGMYKYMDLGSSKARIRGGVSAERTGACDVVA